MSKISIQYNKERFTQSQNNLIQDAFILASDAHQTQQRANGEPYIIHPIAVAELVAEWGLDYEAVIAALLHDVVEDTDTSLDELSSQFSPKIAELVDGVTKMRLSRGPRPAQDSLRLEESNENLRKLLLATAKDYRVLLIKLADRLHNMRTLQHLSVDKRQRIARESLEIYASLADRLGMGQLKGELEDLALRHLKPDEYAELDHLVKMTTKKSARYLMILKATIAKYLEQGSVKVENIEARQKHYYSIYKKLAKTGGDIEKIYDLMAVRIIVSDVAACYQALGVLHQHYRPLIYRIKDYIAVPKPNGYQSLHTTVFADDGRITEIQIRTPQMHAAAEHGLAAHFYYDAQKKTRAYAEGSTLASLPTNMNWVTELSQLQQNLTAGQEFDENLRLELFADRIFVFSPKGDLYDLPEGATPIDFAFAVHSNLGLRVLGAKVNGRIVQLDSRLDNRDVIELLLRREPAPSRDWLNFVATTHAKGRIRAWFRAVSREANIASGRAMLEAELVSLGLKKLEEVPKRSVTDALDVLHVRSMDDVLAQVGEGSLGVVQVIRKLMPEAAKPKGSKMVKRTEPTGLILVEGQYVSYTRAPCCNPVFPQPLLGYLTRGSGVTVHALGCRNIPDDPQRYASCRWETIAQAPELLVSRIKIRAISRIGLLLDVTVVIAREKLNIRNIVTDDDTTGHTDITFELEVADLFVLAGVMPQLERLRGVDSVQRVA